MIHIFIGTKAQFIKMAPIMQELDKRGITYNYIDSGQHSEITTKLRKQFDIRAPDVKLRQGKENITSVFQALRWTAGNIWRMVFRKGALCQELFQKQKGVCLIHGDTLTTLFSLFFAKRCGIRVAHVEAGLRSYNLFDPFPEEIIRLIAMRLSDVLYAPTDWAEENLVKMGYGDKTFQIGGNTIIDAIRYAEQKSVGDEEPKDDYVLVTTHRVETIYSRRRMEILVSLVDRIAERLRVIFVLHKPTRDQLNKFGLMKILHENQYIELSPLQPYIKFIGLIKNANYVITDGGSIQEETYYLNKPCLIMRKRTERMEGLEDNAYLSKFDPQRIEYFMDNWQTFLGTHCRLTASPSARLVDHLMGD